MKPHCRRPLAACLGAALCALRAPGLAGPPRPPPPQHPEGKGIGRPAGVGGGRSPGLPLTSASSCSGKQLLGLSGGQVGKGHPGARSQTAGQGGHLSLTPQHYPGTSLRMFVISIIINQPRIKMFYLPQLTALGKTKIGDVVQHKICIKPQNRQGVSHFQKVPLF